MTLAATGWQGVPQARPAVSVREVVGFASCVVILLLFSQVWIVPLFGHEQGGAESGLIRNMFLPAYALGMILLALRPAQFVFALWRQPVLLFLLGLVITSTFWSVNPDVTTRRAFAVSMTTLCGVALGSSLTWLKLTRVMCVTFLILAVLSVIAVPIPGYGIMVKEFPGAWRGFWMEKNNLGGLMALGLIAFASGVMIDARFRWIWAGGAALALFLIVMSTSKTSLLSGILAVGLLVFVFLVQRGPVLAVISTWLALVAGALVLSVVIIDPELILTALGKDSTLTGRTGLWSAIGELVKKRPLFGYGYAAVWDDLSGWGPMAFIAKYAGFTAHHAHSSWYEMMLGLGYVGLTALILFFSQFVVAAFVSAYRVPGSAMALPIIAVYLLSSFSESVAMIYNDFRWVIVTAVATKLTWPDKYC